MCFQFRTLKFQLQAMFTMTASSRHHQVEKNDAWCVLVSHDERVRAVSSEDNIEAFVIESVV